MNAANAERSALPRTELLNRVVGAAATEAARCASDSLGPEHLLLAPLSQRGGVALLALNEMDVNTDELQSAISDETARVSPDAPSLADVLNAATDEAHARNQPYIGTEHLLLGLMRVGPNTAGRALGRVGVSPEQAHSTITRMLATP